MPVSNAHWVFGRAHATGRERITILSYWRADDPGSDEEQETQVVRCADGQVDSVFVPFHCVDVRSLGRSRPHTLVVGLEGDVALIDPGTQRRELLDDSDAGPLGRGHIRSLAHVSDEIFAVGMQRQVYRRRLPDPETLLATWEHFEAGLSWSPLEMAGFNDLHGFSLEELYAVGWRGEMQLYDGGRWYHIDLPTNVKLERVHAAPDGRVYAAGQRGVLLTGRGDRFAIVPQDVTDEGFWGMCWAFGALWLASPNHLFQLVGDVLEIVDTGMGDDMTFRCLTEAEGRLWSIGHDHVLFTDDAHSWHQVFF